MNKIFIVLLSLFTLSFVSCSNDRGIENDDKNELNVEFSLFSPLTYAAGDIGQEEENINEIDLLIIKDGLFQYRQHAYKSSGNSYRSTLKVDEGITIVVLVNARRFINDCTELTEGADWETLIRPTLTDNDPSRLIGVPDGLPMWGQIEDVTLEDNIINHLGAVVLLRSVASVDVFVTADESNFVMTKAFLYFAPDKGLIAPSASNFDEVECKVLAPEAPASMTTTGILSADAENNAVAYQLYAYDNDASTNSANGKRFSRVVVGGYYNESLTETFYALDFLSDDKSSIIPVTRNNKYAMVITKVNGEGDPDPGEASGKTAVNLNYVVHNWENSFDTDIMIDGPTYLTISRRYSILSRDKNAQDFISASGNLKASTVNMKFATTNNGNAISGGYMLKNDYFQVELIANSNDLLTGVQITALKDYTASHCEEVVKVEAGRLKFEITITQRDKGPDDWSNGGIDEIDLGEEE